MDDEKKIPFTAHLEELRRRLIVCFIAVGIGFVLSYGFKEKLFQILTRPLISVMKTGDKLIFTGLPEAFFYPHCSLWGVRFSDILLYSHTGLSFF